MALPATKIAPKALSECSNKPKADLGAHVSRLFARQRHDVSRADWRWRREKPYAAMLLAHVCRWIDRQHLAHFRGERLFEILRLIVFLPELVAQVFPIELHPVIGADAAKPMRKP